MRIAYLSDATVPSYTANSIQVMKMCQAMAQRRHEIILYIPQYRPVLGLENIDIWPHYGIREKFAIKKIPFLGPVGGHLYGLLATIKATRSRADIIYARHLPSAAIASFWKIPVVCELHQMPGGYTGPFYLRIFMRNGKSNRLIVISRALKTDLINAYPDWIDERRIVVAPDGVDLERFQDLPDTETARRSLSLGVDGFIAGYAGHLYRGKGIGIILGLATRCPQISFLVMGGQPDAVTDLRSQVGLRGLKNVHLQGFVPNSELPMYLAACDVLLLPVQPVVSGSGGGNIARWTSPMKMFEYMASGRLIIASDLPVLREVLNEDNALLCEPDVLECWRRGLERTTTNASWKQGLARQANEDARRYDWTGRIDICLPSVEARAVSLVGQP